MGSSEDGYRFGRWFRDSDKDHKYGRRYGPSSKNFKDGYRYRSQFRNSDLKSRQYKLSPSSVEDGLLTEKEDDKSFNKNNYNENTTYRSIYDKKDEENKYVGISI